MDHNKLIASAAKDALAPLGLKQQGKSRTWYDDHGWWSIVVEFQPSSWSRGTYLNVGVCWHLYEKAHWTFDVGHREQPFSAARDESQFSDVLSRVTEHARRSVEDYRSRFPNVASAHQYYQTTARRGHWDYYYAAVIAALNGDSAAARKSFNSLSEQPKTFQWQQGLHYRALDLARLLDNRSYLLDSISGIALRTRNQLLLDECTPTNLGFPNSTVA